MNSGTLKIEPTCLSVDNTITITVNINSSNLKYNNYEDPLIGVYIDLFGSLGDATYTNISENSNVKFTVETNDEDTYTKIRWLSTNGQFTSGTYVVKIEDIPLTESINVQASAYTPFYVELKPNAILLRKCPVIYPFCICYN